MNTQVLILIMLLLLQVKHFFIDFMLQPPWMWKNKGNATHLGGWAHAAAHAAGTGLVLLVTVPQVGLQLALGVLIFELFAHYLIDYSKVNLTKKLGLGPTTHPNFWVLMGLDQFLHQATYIVVIVLVLPGVA